MAIPTLPGVKRRRGVGNEVAAFAQAFSQTWARLDRENRRGAGRDTGPYSDKAIEEQDPRLSKGIFGGLFGKGEGENLTPYERGMLRQQAIYDLAVKRGDPDAIEKARANMEKLTILHDKGQLGKPGSMFDVTGYDKTGGVEPQVQPVEPQQQQDTALPVSGNDPLYQSGGVGNEAVYTPDYQAFSRGGPVGMPSALPQMSAIPLDNEESDTGTQEQATTYSLPEDPEELGAQAAEAVDAGYRTLAKRLEPTAAMPDEDENYQASIASYARGENRMTDEEVAAIDQAVDPEGSLPRAQRAAARMAAIYRYYKDQGDEETANDVAARLVEYNEFAGQTRASLGMQAIQQGKVQEGVKLLADAYEDNVPDGKSVKANVNPDGSVTVAVGYERKDPEGRISLAPEIERTIPLSELPQLAGALTADGRKMIMGVGAKANQSAAGAGAAPAGTRQAVATYDRAVQALRALPADATEEQREAAYQAALGAYRNAVDSFQVGKGKSKAYAAQQYGVQPPQRLGAAAATAAKGTAEERAAAAAAEEKARLDKRAADIAEDVDYRGAIRESEQDELARRKQADVDMRRIAMGAKNNPAETLKPKERKELYDGISVAADAALSERFNLPDAEKKDDKKATLTKEQRATIVDTAFDLARRNNLSEDQAVRAATNMLRGSLRPDADGMVQAGQFRVAVDPQYVRALAGMRSGLERELRRIATPPAPTAAASPAGQMAAGAARSVAGAIQNIPATSGYVSPELAGAPASEPIRLMRDITPEERPQQEAVALQSELRFLQNKVARRSGSAQEIRAAQERIDELERAIEARVPQMNTLRRRALPE